jgi:CheY-like chemotaxis protein
VRILVVDDERAIRMLLKHAFELWGHEVGDVESGVAALESIRRDRPDLVLLDLLMPGLSGLDVLQRARADGYAGPVVIITGSATTTQIQAARRLGAFDVILKPFSIERLKRLLDTLAAAPPNVTTPGGGGS